MYVPAHTPFIQAFNVPYPIIKTYTYPPKNTDSQPSSSQNTIKGISYSLLWHFNNLKTFKQPLRQNP